MKRNGSVIHASTPSEVMKYLKQC